MLYPRMMRIRQHFQASRIDDVEQAVYAQLDKLRLSQQIHANDTVAIAAGSRGIANIALIIKTLVNALKRCGAKPCIVPAMGSHGGGTVEGQLAILQELGHHRGIYRGRDQSLDGCCSNWRDARRSSRFF